MTPAAEVPPPPFDAGLVEEFLRLFGRAVRAHQLYMHNNPTYVRAIEVLRHAMPPIWAHTDSLTLEVADTQIRWSDVVVVNEPDKSGDALPWVLYKDGIRELTLLRGVEEREIVTLVQVVARVRKAGADEEDLLSILWEQEFALVRYRYVDAGADTVVDFQAPDAAPRLVDPDALREPAVEHVAPPGVVNMDEFDSALYFLDEGEIEALHLDLRRHYDADLRRDVVGILLDVFEQQPDHAMREEVCGNLDSLLVHLLSVGQLGTVAYLLREANVAASRARDVTPAQRELLLSLPNRMSEPDAVAQLLQSLDERADLPPQAELNELFEQLRVGSLATVFAWLGRLNTPAVRRLLESAADRLATGNTAELVRLISAPEREVALEAVRRSGSSRAAAAVPALARVLAQADADMRLEAVAALATIGTAGALQQLERAIDDAARDVRVAAAKALATKAYRAALPRIEATITGRRLQEADLTEKMAFFEAYGTMCGNDGVPMLDGILNRRGFFGRREDGELRACAALALGRVGSDAALSALRRSAHDKEVLVRNAVSRALRGGNA